MAITFSTASKSTQTVNKLLDSVLPGHTTSTALNTPSSSSQIINATQKKLKPEVVRRERKKEKLAQRNATKSQRLSRAEVDAQARYKVLQQHVKEGTLTPEEKVEMKRLVKRNVVNVQSWRLENGEDLKEVQDAITELKKSEYTRVKRRAPKSNKLELNHLYKKKQEKQFPGLTPGLAPVGLSDSEDSEDE